MAPYKRCLVVNRMMKKDEDEDDDDDYDNDRI